ncbi:MAG TPA: hypothetical protein VGO90_02390 [Chthoniobacteraceae bacterium]|jgi:hypothetical protein|nr:hypothetical protein [Chthoniobacter sp.]HEV7866501.1 hypothetical protein [Chthoniobacteraceae bacterium]
MANRRPDARAILLERIRTSPPKFVHLVGVPYAVEIERVTDPLKLDHVWITLEVPPFGRLRVVVNTLSRINRDAHLDGDVRLGIVRSTYAEKPAPGLEECPGFDYATVEAAEQVTYTRLERDALAELLLAKAKVAIRAEVWGELYGRDHIGLHQIHCRRASAAVPVTVRNRDGALKLFYAEEQAAELLLFKFSGQA